MARVNKVWTLADYKKELGVAKAPFHISKAGKPYFVGLGNQAVMIACEPAKAAFVVEMLDKDTGESWHFASDAAPKPLEVAGYL